VGRFGKHGILQLAAQKLVGGFRQKQHNSPFGQLALELHRAGVGRRSLGKSAAKDDPLNNRSSVAIEKITAERISVSPLAISGVDADCRWKREGLRIMRTDPRRPA
jgi:hypothetical protein